MVEQATILNPAGQGSKPVANVNQLVTSRHQCKKNFGSAKTKVKQIIEGLDSSDSGNEAYAMAVRSGVHRTGAAVDSFKMKLNGICVEVIINSGASVNVMGSHMFHKLTQAAHLSINNTHKPELFAYNCETKLPVLGKTTATLEAFGQQMELDWVVVQGSGEILLGRRDAEQLKLLHVGPLVNAICLETKSTALPASTQKVLDAHSSVFSGIGCLKDVKVHITLEDDAVPVACRYTRVPVHLRPALEKELQIQVDAGIIEPVSGPTPWVSRIVVVPKQRPGEVRITVDLRNINRCTRKEHQPIPNLEEQLVNMGTPKYFSYIDGNKMFHQLPLDEESAQLMSFSTGLPNWPLMRYKRMVMGWCNASSRLQEEMRKIVTGLPGVLNIGDDLAVYGDTLEQHNERLSGLLAALEQSGVTVGQEKCKFAVPHIEFMGLVATKNGIQPPEDKVRAIQQIKPPKDK